jgi:type 1 fimbria pilin
VDPAIINGVNDMELSRSRVPEGKTHSHQCSNYPSLERGGSIVRSKSRWRDFRLVAVAFVALAFGSDATAICRLGIDAQPIDLGLIETDFPLEHAGNFVPISPWTEMEWIVADCPPDDPSRPNSIYMSYYGPVESLGEYSEDGKTYTVLGNRWLSFVAEHSKPNSEEMIPVRDLSRQPVYSAVPGQNRMKIRVRAGLKMRPTRPLTTLSHLVLLVGRPGNSDKTQATLRAQVKLLQKTCSIMSGNELSFNVRSAHADQFGGVGSTVDGEDFQLSMRCEPGIRVFATLTDATQPGNRTAVLSLGSGSTARGVGYQILRDGNVPVAFGPDSAEAGAENQFAVADVPAGGGDIELPLKIRYIQTEPAIVPGRVDAVATITFAYQ